MQLHLLRFSTANESTCGLLFVNGVFAVFTLEDGPTPNPYGLKVPGETRIPAGKYKVVVQRAGRLHKKYTDLFPGMHKGMLFLKDVPGFSGIAFHMGNEVDHTDGCILLADSITSNAEYPATAQNSRSGYTRFYKQVIDAAIAGDLELEVSDRGPWSTVDEPPRSEA
jgi:hypothetical protein